RRSEIYLGEIDRDNGPVLTTDCPGSLAETWRCKTRKNERDSGFDPLSQRLWSRSPGLQPTPSSAHLQLVAKRLAGRGVPRGSGEPPHDWTSDGETEWRWASACCGEVQPTGKPHPWISAIGEPFRSFHLPRVKSGNLTGALPCATDAQLSGKGADHVAAS